MNNISIELAALTRKVPAALIDEHDTAMLLWALENIDGLPEHPIEREERLELLSREVCVKRIELLEREMDLLFIEELYDIQLAKTQRYGGRI